MSRPDIECQSCAVAIVDETPYWICPPLGAVCDSCWPNQSRGYLREYRNPSKRVCPHGVEYEHPTFYCFVCLRAALKGN